MDEDVPSSSLITMGPFRPIRAPWQCFWLALIEVSCFAGRHKVVARAWTAARLHLEDEPLMLIRTGRFLHTRLGRAELACDRATTILYTLCHDGRECGREPRRQRAEEKQGGG